MESNREVADRALPRTGAEELAAGSALSAGAEGSVVDLEGSAEAKAAARAVVEVSGDVSALLLSKVSEVGAFGEILAEETIGILVGAAFPSVVRVGEVELGVQLARDIFEAMEFGAVVGGEAADGMGFVLEQEDGSAGGERGSGLGEFADANEAAFAFDGGGDAGLAAAMDGVQFPVAEAGASVHHEGRWSIMVLPARRPRLSWRPWRLRRRFCAPRRCRQSVPPFVLSAQIWR